MPLRLKPKNNDDTVYSFRKEARPKFGSGNGRTWDYTSILIDNIPHKVWYDTSWGWYYHVQYDNIWYRHPIIFKMGHPDCDKKIDLENFVYHKAEFERAG